MRTSRRSSLLLMLVPTVTLITPPQNPHSHNSVTTGPAGWAALVHSMHRMHGAMGSIESSGDPDVDFVRLMLPHHDGAVDMAKIELLDGTDEQLRRLAQEIITDQESEIQLMKLWLNKHQIDAHGSR